MRRRRLPAGEDATAAGNGNDFLAFLCGPCRVRRDRPVVIFQNSKVIRLGKNFRPTTALTALLTAACLSPAVLTVDSHNCFRLNSARLGLTARARAQYLFSEAAFVSTTAGRLD